MSREPARERDQLLRELVELWAGGGAPKVRLADGRIVPRRERESELIRALRPLCWMAAQQPSAPRPKPGGKNEAAPKPKADPA